MLRRPRVPSETNYPSTVSGEFALLLCQFGQFDGAFERAECCRRLARPDDVASQILWRTAEALVCIDRGAQHEAVSLAREAIPRLADTGMIEYRGHASRALAHALAKAGRQTEAVASASEAIGFLEQNGLFVSAARARAQLKEILGSPA
jgi:hypothetical protein